MSRSGIVLVCAALVCLLLPPAGAQLCPDELGDSNNVYNNIANGMGRGNIIDVTADVFLTEIQQDVNLDSIEEVRWVVKRWLGASWTIEFELIQPSVGPGRGPNNYWSSGPIQVPLNNGERYAIMMYWSSWGDYYNRSSHNPQPLSFGSQFQNAYENSYPPSTFVGSVTNSWIPHQWFCTSPPCLPTADLQVRTVDTAPTAVLPGQTGIPLSVTVENVGSGDADTIVVDLSFMGAVDRTPEYTVTPDPGNPTLIPASTLETFLFTVDVSPAATPEAITIDAGVTGNDVGCPNPLSDPDADQTDSWLVSLCVASACGDCDSDGFTTILDALLAAQNGALVLQLTGQDFTNCNVIGTLEPTPGAVVDVLDALVLAQFAAQLPVQLTCC